VAWDVHGCERGLIVGYDEGERRYATLTDQGQTHSLAYERLGKNGIDILSVAIPGEPNGRSRDEIVRNSLFQNFPNPRTWKRSCTICT